MSKSSPALTRTKSSRGVFVSTFYLQFHVDPDRTTSVSGIDRFDDDELISIIDCLIHEADIRQITYVADSDTDDDATPARTV